jgi:hypothetical protein
MDTSDQEFDEIPGFGSANIGHLPRIFDMTKEKSSPVYIKESAPTSHLPKAAPPTDKASAPTSHLPTAAPKTGGNEKK